MRRGFLLSLAVCLAAVWSVPAKAADAIYQLKVVTDRPHAIYSVGENAKFCVTLSKDGKPMTQGQVLYQIDAGGMPPVVKGKLELTSRPAGVEATLPKPGFLLCRVRYLVDNNEVAQATAGAGFDPQKIAPSLPPPDDFDAFWAEQKAALKAVPMDPKLTPVTSPVPAVECFDVQVACVAPRPVSGYYARPVGAAQKSLPAILYVHGAGVADSDLVNAAGRAKTSNALSLDINAHGIPNGKPEEYYKALNDAELKGYRFAGREDRRQCYFLGMFLRATRALEFLTSQPEWDGKVLIVEGSSQGGGQSIAAAGLDDRVTFIAAGVPAICDHSGRVVGRPNGWPELVPAVDGKPDPKILDVARYFDCVNFAGRAKAEACFSVGLIDTSCPPSSVYAAFNNLRGKKQIIVEPLMGHAAPEKITRAFQNAIVKHIARLKGKK